MKKTQEPLIWRREWRTRLKMLTQLEVGWRELEAAINAVESIPDDQVIQIFQIDGLWGVLVRTPIEILVPASEFYPCRQQGGMK